MAQIPVSVPILIILRGCSPIGAQKNFPFVIPASQHALCLLYSTRNYRSESDNTRLCTHGIVRSSQRRMRRCLRRWMLTQLRMLHPSLLPGAHLPGPCVWLNGMTSRDSPGIVPFSGLGDDGNEAGISGLLACIFVKLSRAEIEDPAEFPGTWLSCGRK